MAGVVPIPDDGQDRSVDPEGPPPEGETRPEVPPQAPPDAGPIADPGEGPAAGPESPSRGGSAAEGGPSGVRARAARPVPGGWTTRRWLIVGTCAALVVLLVLALAGGWVFARSSRLTDNLSDSDTPALVAAAQLEDTLVSQETGVRGYGITGQRSFLQPYTDGLDGQRRDTAALRALLGHDTRAVHDLDALLSRTEVWQSRIARPIAAAPPGAPVALATQRADEGKGEFDAVRTAANQLERTLTQRRDKERSDLRRADAERDWIFGVIAAVITALTVLIFVGLRRGVTRPLDLLSGDVRKVAEGDFGHRVTASGPADIRALAADVESMRERLADALVFSDSVRGQLDEQAADLRRSNAELEQFAYVASHDLQEPLRKVASFCQLLQRRYAAQLDDRAGQYIEYAVDGANRMQTLINDLLAFSRVGRVHADSAAVDLEALYTRTAESLSLAVEESGAELTHDPLPVVSGDATQLGMLLQNLLSNAVKFRAPERPPRIHLSVAPDGDDRWTFAVTDNGIGIAPEFAERVFVIFQRLHTRDAYPGNGIGLALCKKIVDFHGGAVSVDADHAPGTRIVFTLPRRAEEPDPAQEEQPAAERPGSAGEGAGTTGTAGGARTAGTGENDGAVPGSGACPAPDSGIGAGQAGAGR